MSRPTQRIIESNGIRLNIVEQGEGPLVLMCHGFPESWYSWRHQVDALAAAGFHAVALDMRGYGKSDAPEAIDQYTIFHLVGDLTGLLDALTDRARIVMVSSAAHRFAPRGGIDWDNLRGETSAWPMRGYCRSKFANLLFAKELARRLAGTGKTANAVHPGFVAATDIFRGMALAQIGRAYWPRVMTALVAKTIPEGAATSCYVAASPLVEGLSGQYFSDCNIAKPRADTDDPALAARLWELSETIAGSV